MSTESFRAPTSTKVVVATTVALSFISFWRGASIVLSDLASSAFYAGGIAEHAIGKSAAWFVLGVMLFSFTVRSVYMESCGMFVRGGVYVVVRDSMGPFLARISVSSLVFDYVLTGPISVVSAGQYLGRLLNEVSALIHQNYVINPNYFAAFFGVIVTIYFWWSNIKGIHESSGKALRIMQITTVMVVMLLIWCPLTLLLRGTANWPPPPTPANIHFSPEALGWFQGTFWPTIPMVAIIIAFGHSLLSMSGFETLAQVYREIAYPKMKNLKITANIVCWYAVVSTGFITVFATMIILGDFFTSFGLEPCHGSRRSCRPQAGGPAGESVALFASRSRYGGSMQSGKRLPLGSTIKEPLGKAGMGFSAIFRPCGEPWG